jgi:hypothetical protein
MPLVFGGLWIALPKTPFKPFGAQESSGMGWLFLWILSFGQTKESISAVGPRPDIKKAVALATPIRLKERIYKFPSYASPLPQLPNHP